jgi:hypothetical protein
MMGISVVTKLALLTIVCASVGGIALVMLH